MLAGDAQSGVVGQRLSDTLNLRVTDSRDRPVAGQRIAFTVLAGGAASLLLPDTAVTDANGTARSVWVLGGLAGEQRIEARVLSPVAGGALKVTFSAQAAAAPPDKIFAVEGQGQTGLVGVPLSDSLVVMVTDQFGNPLPGQTVTWRVPAGQGSVSAGTTTTGVDGRTAVARRLGPVAGAQSASAMAAALAGQIVTFDHTAIAGQGSSNRLAFLNQPGTGMVGQAITPALQVAVQDDAGNTIATATDSIRLSLTPGSGTLGGVIGVRAVGGIATFDAVTVGVSGTYSLTAFAPLSPLLSATTSPFSVAAGTSTTVITSDSPDPTVVGEHYTVAYAVSSPGGTPSGNVTVSDGSGTCTAALSGGSGSCGMIATAAGPKTVVATYAGDASFAGSTSPGATHDVNQAASSLTITGDASDPSGVGDTITVSWSVVVVAPGNGTPTGTVSVSDGTEATCSAPVAAGSCQLALSATGAHTLTATYGGDSNFLSSSDSEPHTVSSAATTSLTITSDSPDPSEVGQPYRVVFELVVSAGSGLPTGTVTVSEGAASCTAAVTAGSCDLTSPVTGTRTVVATYSGDATFAGTTSAAVQHSVIAAPLILHLVFTTQPSDVKRGDQFKPKVRISILDENNQVVVLATNPVTIALGQNPLGLATLRGTLTVTPQDGVAVFGNLDITGLTPFTGLVLLASSPGLDPVESNPFDAH